jgi:AraC-like DNA-binding protein
MLRTSDPLCRIALSCGMSDQAHFCKAFKRLVGEPPGRWRARSRDSLAVENGDTRNLPEVSSRL